MFNLFHERRHVREREREKEREKNVYIYISSAALHKKVHFMVHCLQETDVDTLEETSLCVVR